MSDKSAVCVETRDLTNSTVDQVRPQEQVTNLTSTTQTPWTERLVVHGALPIGVGRWRLPAVEKKGGHQQD